MKDFIHKHQIRSLFHFTRATNLQNILKYGLLPRKTLEEKKINAVFNDSYRLDNCKNALCASISFPNYKMFYCLREADKKVDWAVIELNARLLLNYRCAFCVTNAGSAEVSNTKLEDRMGVDALKKLYEDYPDKPTRQEMNLPVMYPTNPQAEVLIFGDVPLNYIKAIYFSTDDILKKYEELFSIETKIETKIAVYTNPYLFLCRKDWLHWKS